MSDRIGYTCYIRLRTKAAKRDTFVRLMSELRRNALDQEPGTLVFEILQGSDPNELVIFECFANEAAQQAHQNAPYHVAMSAEGWACLDGAPVIEFLKPAL